MPTSISLQVEALTKSHPTTPGKTLTVLQDISFSLRAGESLAITGPSGSGKTTLLSLCATLDSPSSGSIFIDGTDVTALTEDARAALRNRSIGFVFQNFQLLPSLTALENILVPLELRGRTLPSHRLEALALLDRVGLQGRHTHYPRALSGGEQQRVALARAFIHQPKLLFCDEPTGNLDGETAQQIIDLLFSLNQEQHTTLILVTHDMELAARCQHHLRLKSGRLLTPLPATQP